MKNLIVSKNFHNHLDDDLVFWSCRDRETERAKLVTEMQKRMGKNLIIKEREFSYQFYLHQHPYVQQLVQRLIRDGTAGLQAADTEYSTDNASLPGSLDIALAGNSNLTIPVGSKVVLLTKVQATSAAVTIELEPKMKIRTVGTVSCILPDGLKSKLIDGMKETPLPGALFTPPANSKAVVSADTKIILKAAAAIVLYDGTQATLPAETQVLLVSGTQVTIPNDIQVKLLKSKPRPVSDLYSDFFETTYKPNIELVQHPYPVKDLDFSSSGAYSVYNWELFFHIPLTIGIHLSKNQRFAEAQHWFHYVFDPTDNSEGPTPERFWKVRPFQYTDVKKTEEILVNLVTGEDKTLRDETILSLEAWMCSPFQPHVIARYRQQAYMYKTVMAYLDNLIAWGDSLFRQDTGEAIDEAMMVYVLAANILGPRPQPVPKKGAVRPQNYANLRNDLKQFGIVMRNMEPDLPFDVMPFPADVTGDNNRLATVGSLGKALYFCVPRNDKLLSYWDTVADRLFKIRNSLNIQGIFRQLPLFEPPIDPGMLARAAAAGLDVGAIINGLNQPLPLVRFQFLVQMAAEICQEVKSLGNNLLMAMEKEDNENLAVLRAKHERIVLEMVEHVKYSQLQEVIKSKEGLLKSLALAVQRYNYYERQLGKKPDEIERGIPILGELDKDSLDKMKFSMKEPEMSLQEIEVDIAQDLGASGGKIISKYERQELKLSESAAKLREEAANLDLVAKFLSIIPELGAQVEPMGVGAAIQFGGRALSTQISLAADGNRIMAERDTYEANKAAKIGSYARRQQDWAFQSNLAAGEITQIFNQLRTAQIREAISELELKNHRQQMKHAEEIEHFLNEEGTEKTGKKTNKALYTWMKREVKGLYAQSFQFAFDIAKKAERALQHELGNQEISYIHFGYLAGKEGLLAGERLYLDIKHMEIAYNDLNRREYELTKHVSLFQVDPLALIKLRTTGRCTLKLDEALFDIDCPGHYFRRIKTLALSIPCVTGPSTNVNCTLTLLKSSIRTTQILIDGGYAREGAEDSRFSDYFGSLQSIVTSSSQNDSGLFETNLHDERYLPFENSGVISEWQLELPANPSKDDPCQFDYDTITDVIMHIRYTAREGGDLLAKGALANLKALIADSKAVGSVRLFSVRHEFPTEWAKFKSVKLGGAIPTAELKLNLREEHYPFWSKNKDNKPLNETIALEGIEFFSKPSKGVKSITVSDQAEGEKTFTLDTDSSFGDLLRGKQINIPLPTPVGTFSLYFKDNSMEDLWFALTWSK